MNARHTLLAVLLSTSLSPATALAQGADADKATARELVIEGYQALQSNDYAAAADRFTRAEALYHAPTVTLGLARTYVGLGKLVSAQELYYSTAHEDLASNASNGIKKAVLDAQKELDALTPRIPSVIINVKGSDNARVTLDGAEVRTAALGVKRPVDPGTHIIKASAPGFAVSEVTVTLAEGKSESVLLDLNPPKVETPPVVAVAPVAKPPAPAPVMVTPAPTPPASTTPAPVLSAQPEPTPDHIKASISSQKTVGFAAIGVGAVGLLVGGITGGLALSKHDDLAELCPEGHCALGQKAALEPKVDSYNTMGAISTTGFVVGGVLAATGILVLTAPKTPTVQATVTPLIGLGFVGMKWSF